MMLKLYTGNQRWGSEVADEARPSLIKFHCGR